MIYARGRHLETYVVDRPFDVIGSTADDLPIGVYPGVGGSGGGAQYQLPANWLGRVTRVNR